MAKKKRKGSIFKEIAKGTKAVLNGFAEAGSNQQPGPKKKSGSKCGSC